MARTDSKWQVGIGGSYITTIAPLGYDILINGSNKYLNFGTTVGSTGYGIRDNGGVMEFKDSGGSWAPFGTGGGGGGTLADTSALSTDATKSLYTMTSTVPVEFRRSAGSTLLYLDEANGRIGIGTNAPLGQLHIDGGATIARSIIDADNNVAKILSFRTGNVARWALRVDGNETGSNVGSDFAIRRYSDAGGVIDAPLSIDRATGTVTIDNALSATYATASTIAIFDASKNLISASTSTYPDLTELSYLKGVTSGIQAQINALSGALTYYGTWNASTNTPTLTSSSGITGQYYVVSVAGSTNLDGITTWNVGDWAIFNGTVWERLINGSAVSSVSGTANRITSTGGSTPVIDIASTYVGQTSITTLGTIGTGTWQATAIANAYITNTLTGKTYNGVNLTTGGSSTKYLSEDGTYSTPAGGGGGVTSVGTGDYLTGGPITTTGTINVANEIELSIVTSLLFLSSNF